MDAANLTASWISALVTTVGLGSVVAQVAGIKDQLDPFKSARGEDHLAAWGIGIDQPKSWYNLAKPPPKGPVIEADIDMCLGVRTLWLSRKPKCKVGTASWTTLLAVFHPSSVQPQQLNSVKASATDTESLMMKPMPKARSFRILSSNTLEPVELPWHLRLRTQDLIFHESTACTTMSRNTFIIFVLLGGSRHSYSFDGPAGLRLGFGSYNGNYRLEWPIGARPTLRFEPHTNYQRGRDAFPVYFPRRPKKCVEMALGIIERGIDDAGKCIRVAFAGRKKPGPCLLKLLPKRFGAQRSAADWWNNFGGEAHEVDFFFRERWDHETTVPLHDRILSVPSLVDEVFSTMYLPRTESAALADCLDHVPWSPIAWSIHRGMKDILVAYALPYLKAYRAPLVAMLHSAVTIHALTLIQEGWEPAFVKGHMADQAASALFGEDKCSGDVCRIFSAIVEAVSNKSIEELDHTQFWVQHLQIPAEKAESEVLSGDTAAALIKAHFVWWSTEFDYDIYSKLPLNITVT